MNLENALPQRINNVKGKDASTVFSDVQQNSKNQKQCGNVRFEMKRPAIEEN
jgi:hypothetical protein